MHFGDSLHACLPKTQPSFSSQETRYNIQVNRADQATSHNIGTSITMLVQSIVYKRRLHFGRVQDHQRYTPSVLRVIHVLVIVSVHPIIATTRTPTGFILGDHIDEPGIPVNVFEDVDERKLGRRKISTIVTHQWPQFSPLDLCPRRAGCLSRKASETWTCCELLCT